MNKFITLAVLMTACLALGSCSGNYNNNNYGHEVRKVTNYAPKTDNGAAAAAAAASADDNQNSYDRPVEIIAKGPRYGHSEHLKPILLDSGYHGGYNNKHHGNSYEKHNHGYGHHGYGHNYENSYGKHNHGYGHGYGHNYENSYGKHNHGYGHGYGHNSGYGHGYGHRYSGSPLGATLLYPGVNHYRRYSSPVEYSKVVLPVRVAPPVAKLYVPENNYGHNYERSYDRSYDRHQNYDNHHGNSYGHKHNGYHHESKY